MDKAEIMESIEPEILREILATKPFLSESCTACYVSAPAEDVPLGEKITYRVLVLEDAWIHLIHIEYNRPWQQADRGEPVIRYSIGTDAVKSIETRWRAPDTFEEIDEALEVSGCEATIFLDQELGDIGKRIPLPLAQSDYGSSRRNASRAVQSFVKALLLTRS